VSAFKSTSFLNRPKLWAQRQKAVAINEKKTLGDITDCFFKVLTTVIYPGLEVAES
jgi:hypothetical protein